MINAVLAAVAGDWSIPLAAVILSAAGLGYGIFGTGRRDASSSLEQAMSDRITDLTNQVAALRDDNKECARRCRDLERENLGMLRKLAKMENGQ